MYLIHDRKIARRRRGQALVEFAIVALFLGVLLGAMVSFGHMFCVSHTIEQAVDVAAQEIARMPLRPVATLGLEYYDPAQVDDGVNVVAADEKFRKHIYDERHLIIDRDSGEEEEKTLAELARELPLLNRLLVPAMIADPTMGSSDKGVYRYPGTVVISDEGYATVVIPIVSSDGSRIDRWVKPVEEMLNSTDDPANLDGRTNGSFSVDRPGDLAGTVQLRINYPFQAAGLINYVTTDTSGNVTPVTADDDQAEGASLPDGYNLPDSFNDGTPSINSGRFGLGRVAAYQTGAQSLGVRPWRRVIIAQAIYRREVFE